MQNWLTWGRETGGPNATALQSLDRIACRLVSQQRLACGAFACSIACDGSGIEDACVGAAKSFTSTAQRQ